MIVKDHKEYYPLEFGKMVKDGKTYYDRSERKKNYFYLDLNLTRQLNSPRVRENNE